MKVLMLPHLSQFRKEESGIRRVVESYFKYLPQFGVELVDLRSTSYDLRAVHAGGTAENCEVAHLHGLYFTADYPLSPTWEYVVNANIVKAVRSARQITVPSKWVGEIFQRDVRTSPHIVPHGIEWDEWQHDYPSDLYVLWNKNRDSDVCEVEPVGHLARKFRKLRFLSTFAPDGVTSNVIKLGITPHRHMKMLIQKAGVYLSTTKETFGIGVLEAMASGVPVLGFNWGGNVDLVQHGVNGYLAEPGNMEDLADGLNYCFVNRDTLGQNGREMAKTWTWEKACEQVFQIYQLAMEYQPAQVTVIIPSFNYADKVSRAINSALEQTHDYVREIIVVDDGSEDDGETERVVMEINSRDERVRYVRTENRGVAYARNTGIELSRSKYVCCLDADDAIAPDFVATCVDALEADPSLSIAYTGLHYIKPDGEEGTSPWPGEFDFNAQLLKRNQIPTCCVFKRDMWERLGGYRQRYAPLGAGAEDAEFWLRAGAYGFNAKKVTDRPLFIYSWMSGRVSGSKNYTEPDWTSWHPWAGKNGDGQHPFASVASPKKHSHPVRQYDRPIISVIIPVSPEHRQKVADALDSLEAQTFRRWEVVVVWDNVTVEELMGKWEVQDLDIARIMKAYPYIRSFTINNTSHGPGYARNRGVELSRAPFIFFLDADDWLLPNALQHHLGILLDQGESIVYSDYVGKAEVKDPSKLASDLEIKTTLPTGKSIISHKAAKYDCERAQHEPLLDGNPPYIWANVSCLIPKGWHNEIGGFDESMLSWEDIDYHWRMARAGKCYTHLEDELLVYRFYTGSRRNKGLDNKDELLPYLKGKYERMKTMPCSSCGGKRRTAPSTVRITQSTQSTQFSARPAGQEVQVSDQDFVLALFNDGNRGFHEVVGGHVFPYRIEGLNMRSTGTGFRIVYGQRRSGERFLVHKDDITSSRAGTFTPVAETQSVREPSQIAPQRSHIPPPPTPVTDSPSESDTPSPPPLLVVEEEAVGIDDNLWDKITGGDVTIPEPSFDLQSIPGVTPSIAMQFETMEINSYQDVVDLGVDNLIEIRGIGEVRAKSIYDWCVKAVS